MLVCASFSDQSLHSAGSFRAFEKVASEDKFAYTHRGAKWATFSGGPATQAQLGFFDRYLRGRDTPKPPPVRLEVRERGDLVAEVRSEQEWPLARTQWTDLFLGGGGILSADPAAVDASVTFDTRRNAAAFTFPDCAGLGADRADEPRALRVRRSGGTTSIFSSGWKSGPAKKYVPFEGSFGFGRDRIGHRLAARLAPGAGYLGVHAVPAGWHLHPSATAPAAREGGPGNRTRTLVDSLPRRRFVAAACRRALSGSEKPAHEHVSGRLEAQRTEPLHSALGAAGHRWVASSGHPTQHHGVICT